MVRIPVLLACIAATVLAGGAVGAIEREKQIKGWTRAKKIALIENNNPGWHDLSGDLWCKG